MKNTRLKILVPIIIFFLVLLLYISNIDNIPDSIILFQGEMLNINTLFGLGITSTNQYDVLQTSSNIENNQVIEEPQKVELSVSLLNIFKVKDVTVNVIPKTKVIPLGNAIGLKLYTNGVLVVGMSEIENIFNKKDKPYEDTGIQEGDMIVSINQNEVTCTADLIENVNKSEGNTLAIEYVRDGEIYTTNIRPSQTSTDEYKLGLWVRDTAAGIGTISFYEPSTGLFAALGHGILDIDTQELISIAKGEAVTANIISIKKGEKGEAGEIKGTVANQQTIGEVYKNTNIGIYGTLKNRTALNISSQNEMEVALRSEIKEGPAKIICSLENNKKEEYDIVIEKIYENNNQNNKSMEIRVTDKELIEKTGGIIQGMSGSPIIQDGKFVGAVTHVLLSEPTRGYAVFADLMIKQIREVK